MENVSLPPRLAAVADSVPASSTLADIGTEQASLPAHLLLAGRCALAVGIDRSPRALSAARQRMDELGLSARCELRPGDGLAPLRAGEAEVVVVAGVGARSIIRMLRSDLARLAGAQPVPLLICQPMSEPHLLRHWIADSGRPLRIGLLRERLAEDAGRYYHVLIAGSPEQKRVVAVPEAELARACALAGPLAIADLGLHLLAGPDPLLGPYLDWRRRSLRHLAARAGESGSRAGERRAEAARLLEQALAQTVKALEQVSLG